MRLPTACLLYTSTVTEELTSDAQGNLGTLEGIPFGTVTVKELTAPEGYRLDTEVHTYTAVSYTHLDVYKRQEEGTVIEKGGNTCGRT